MWAGRRTGKGKGQRDRIGKTSIRTESFQARVTDLDPIRVSPYGPAACHLPHREAGHTTAPDRMHRADQKLLASTGASTHVRSGRGILRPAGEIGARSRPDLLPEWSFTTSARPAHHDAAEPLPCPRVTPPPGRPGAEQECRTAAAPCATKLSLKGLLLRAMTAAAAGRGADHGRPAIGARSARRNYTPAISGDTGAS